MDRTWIFFAGIGAFLAGCAQTSTTHYRVQQSTPPVTVVRDEQPAPDTSITLAPQPSLKTLSPTSDVLRENPPLPRGPTVEQPPLAPLDALTHGEGSFVLRQPGEQEPGIPLPLHTAEAQSSHRLDTQPDNSQPPETLQYGEKVPLDIPVRPPNETSFGKVKFSGILVEVAKTPNPLQLLNPFAQGNYSPEDNVVRDPNGHISGLKAFSVGF